MSLLRSQRIVSSVSNSNSRRVQLSSIGMDLTTQAYVCNNTNNLNTADVLLTQDPHNWSMKERVLITTLIGLYTFAVYVGSSIYSPSQEAVQEVFHKSHVEGSLGLALYVLGYGIGCLLFSPLSEIPVRTLLHQMLLLHIVSNNS